MRCLVSCQDCKRQYDATGYAPKSRFHCSCGSLVEVPRFRTTDAAVVRCSSCSAPRSRDARACKHCGADYTLHEQDLQTVCPSCMTRVSDHARYCHHCATLIAPQGAPGRETRRPCPACGRRHKLRSRDMGEPPVAILECDRCAGLWLSSAIFDHLADAARSRTLPEAAARSAPAGDAKEEIPGGAAYRRCPQCDEFMHRRNYGNASGVLIDTCREHGLWFDARELEQILQWIRSGAEETAEKRREDAARHRERLRRIQSAGDAIRQGSSQQDSSMSSGLAFDLLGELLGSVFDL